MSTALEAEVIEPTQALAVSTAAPPDKAPSADSKPAITPAQAKVEAIANLTMRAYERAATLQLTEAEIEALKADFPDSDFLPGAGGKEHLIYIQHAALRDRLNAVLKPGQWAIVPRSRWAEPFTTEKGKDGSRVYVEAMLIVRGCFVAEAVGEMEYYPHNPSQNYGDAVEGAKTAALRRCCKEFGVGLQAWRKDWVDRWWARRRGGRDFSRKPAQPAGPPSTSIPVPKNLATATQRNPVTFPTDQSRAKMIYALKAGPGEANRDIVTEYFRKVENPSQLMPNEEIESLPLRFVPATVKQMTALSEMLTRFGKGDRAQAAFPPHQEPEPSKAPAPAKPTAAKPPDDEWWRDVIVPIPHKGEKRDEYLKHPETIGQLYEMRHGQDEESQAARQRLWGFITHYEPKGWTKHDGTEMPPSDTDLKFREALDALADWHERNHPDEKL